MLLDQQRGRRQDRNLVTLEHGRERCAQRHLGLAEAYVSTDEPIHRPAGGEVVEHLLHGAFLVVRQPVREAGRECAHFRRRGLDGGHGSRGALGLQLQQFGGDVPQLAFRAPLDPVPGVRAQPVQRRVLRAPAGIAGNQLHVGHGHVEAVVAGVPDAHELGRRTSHVHVLQSLVTADTVVLMHHGRSGDKVGQALQNGFGRRLPPPPAPGKRSLPAEQFALGENGQVVAENDSVVQRALGQAQRRSGGQEIAPGSDVLRVELPAAQQLANQFALTGGFRGQQDAPAGRLRVGFE